MRVPFALFMAFTTGCSSNEPGEPGAPDALVDAAPTIDAAPCSKPVVFINTLPSAETFEPGADDGASNHSSMLTAAATVTGMQGDTAGVVAAARARLEPLGIVVTDVDPGARAHIEIVIVGGGWPFDPSYVSLAPSACVPLKKAVAMVNAFPGRQPPDLAVSIAFALGVMNGLEYSTDSKNCMELFVGSTCSFSTASTVKQPPRCPSSGAAQDQITILTTALGCK